MYTAFITHFCAYVGFSPVSNWPFQGYGSFKIDYLKIFQLNSLHFSLFIKTVQTHYLHV